MPRHDHELRLNDCREIHLADGSRVLIDEADWSLVEGLTLYVGPNGYVYFSRQEDGRRVTRTLHRHLVPAADAPEVDHRNGDKLDNRRANLRPVTRQQNQVNRKALNSNNLSGVRGVTFLPHVSARRPWRASIGVAGRTVYLGSFATKGEAVTARLAAELRHFGEHCPTNATTTRDATGATR